jgi:hypothetical protein
VICTGSAKGAFESFFVGENGFTGVLLLHHSFDMNRSLEVACIAKIRKTENDIAYVTPVDCCIVRSTEAVYNMPERSAFAGFVKIEHESWPLLTPQSLYDPFMKSEADFVPSTMFCVG